MAYVARTAVDNWWTKHQCFLGYDGENNHPLSGDNAVEDTANAVKEMLKKYDTVAFIGWEPEISRLRKLIPDMPAEQASIADSMNPPDISFDLEQGNCCYVPRGVFRR